MKVFEDLEGIDKHTVQTYIDTRVAASSKPFTTKEIGEIVSILVPEVRIPLVKKIVSLTFYVVVMLVYLEKQPVKLPYLGTFFAKWRQAKEWYKELSNGEVIENVLKARWDFVFKSNLMKPTFYNKYYEKHSRDAERLLGKKHSMLDEDIKKAFEREFGQTLNWDAISDREAYYEFKRSLLLKDIEEIPDESDVEGSI